MTAADPAPRPDAFQRRAFLIVLALVTVGFVMMVSYFLLTLFMAGVFAGLSYGFYKFMLRKLHKPALAALTTLLILLLVVVIPILAVVMVAYQQAFVFFQTFNYESLPGSMAEVTGQIRQRYPSFFSSLHISPQEMTVYASEGGKKALEWLLKQGANWSLMAAGGLVNVALKLFIMFYFYLDGPRIIDRLIRWSPLPDDYERAMLEKFLVVGRGTLKGIFIIGSLQGVLNTILFWAVGVSSPILLGVLTVFASVIPAFGAGLVWFPVALFLLISGKFVQAAIVFGVGAGVISLVDNLLRPAVVGKDIKMHDVMVLISTLGGLAMFGLPGFIIGPILAAVFLSVWTIFEKMFAHELARNRTHVKPPEL
jgi:predicted PurR-regulated permease PerM